MKKRLFVFLAALLIVVQLAACAPAATEAPAAPAAPAATEAPAAPAAPAATEAPAAPAAPAAGALPEIVVACWSGPEHDNLVKVAEAYTKATGNKVTVEEVARESYQDKLNTTFVANSSDYDAFYANSEWMAAWIKAEALADLAPFMKASKDFKLEDFKGGIDYYTFGDKIYAIPSEGDTAWLFYRKDLFDAKGVKVPETWDDYYAAAKTLNNPPEVYGGLIAAKPDEAWWDFGYTFFSFGGQVLDANNKPAVNSEAGQKALEFYVKMYKDGLTPPDVATYGYNEVLTALQEGKVAMGIQWMAATMTLTDCTQSPKVCKDGQPLLGYAKIPGYKAPDGKITYGTSGSQWGWAVPAGSKKQEAGYKFIEWLTGPEGGKMWALNGGIPGNARVLADPEVVAKIPQFKMLAEIMPIRHIFPLTTVTGDLVTTFNDAIVAAVTGTKDPKAALDDANAKMTDILTKSGEIK
jgi:multiple sugar transport system substrate-binding protein